MDFAALANRPAPIIRRARSYRAETITIGPTNLARPWEFRRFDWPALMLLEHDVFDLRCRITVQPISFPEIGKGDPSILVAVGLTSPNLGITPSVSAQTLFSALNWSDVKGTSNQSGFENTFDCFAGGWELSRGTGIGGWSNGGVLNAVRRFEGATKASAWPSLYCYIPSTDRGGTPLTPDGAIGPITLTVEWAVVATRSTWAEAAAAEAQDDWNDGNIVNETMDNLGWLCDLSPDPALGQYKPEQVDVLAGAARLTDLTHFWSVFEEGAV